MGMKMWFPASLALHFAVGAAYAFTVLQGPKYEDVSAVEVQSAPRPRAQNLQPEFADTGEAAKKKPLIETNKPPLPAPVADSGPSGPTNASEEYVPDYLADELPQPVTPISPEYPEEARRLGLEGRVVMLVYIDASGVVQNVEIQKSPGDVLSAAARKTLLTARFRPARIHGSFKAVKMQLTLKFHLE